MRVLILSTCYPRRSQPGRGIALHRQVRALVELGVECHVLQPVAGRALWSWGPRDDDARQLIDGVPVHHPVVWNPPASTWFPSDAWERMGQAVGDYIAAAPRLRSADLIYTQFLCHEGYAGSIAAQTVPLPFAAIARGDDVHVWPARGPDRRDQLATVMRQANVLMACSPQVARAAAAWAPPGYRPRFAVIYDGVDLALFRPCEDADEQRACRRRFDLDPQRNWLLCVAAAARDKGWLDLLDAFARIAVRFPNWRLAMVGGPRDADCDLRHESALRGLHERAVWLGALHPELMPFVYRAADAFVLANHHAGLANALTEAMATGLPITATRVGGHGDVLDADSAWLTPPQDPAALAGALEAMLSDAVAARQRGRAARRKAEDLGTPRDNARQLLTCFESVVQRAPAPSTPAGFQLARRDW